MFLLLFILIGCVPEIIYIFLGFFIKSLKYLKKTVKSKNDDETQGKNTSRIKLFLRLESRCTSLRGIGMEGVAF
jgi:hypothetical protein